MFDFDKRFLFWFFKYLFILGNIALFIICLFAYNLNFIHLGTCNCILEYLFVLISVLFFFSCCLFIIDLISLFNFLIKNHFEKKQRYLQLLRDVEFLKNQKK